MKWEKAEVKVKVIRKVNQITHSLVGIQFKRGKVNHPLNILNKRMTQVIWTH